MAITLAQTRAAAQLVLDNPGTSAISNSQWSVLINRANQDVWRLVIGVEPSYFEVNTRIVFPPSVDNIDVSGPTYLNAAPYKITEMFWLPQDAPRSPGNRPTRMTPEPFQEHARRLNMGGNTYQTNNGAPQPLYYALRGDRQLYVSPFPQSPAVLDIFYIPLLPAISADSDEVLAGRCDEFQDAVAYRAAFLANSKRQGTNPVVATLWQEASELIKNRAEPRQVAESRRVHAAYGGNRGIWG